MNSFNYEYLPYKQHKKEVRINSVKYKKRIQKIYIYKNSSEINIKKLKQGFTANFVHGVDAMINYLIHKYLIMHNYYYFFSVMIVIQRILQVFRYCGCRVKTPIIKPIMNLTKLWKILKKLIRSFF